MDAAARAHIYTFFSRLFIREMDDTLEAALSSDLGRALLPGWDGAQDRTALDADFVNLTVVNVTPYESFYVREDGMVESGGANPLAAFLLKYGFEADLAAARSISADHIGIELELMGVFCARQAEALHDNQTDYATRIQQVQVEFLREHLLRWAPVYFLAVQRTAKTTLYREGADAALQFLLTDHALLTSGGPA
jgi:TorA maturation chaperone TorD